MDVIDSFQGKYDFLSNFYLRPIQINARGIAGITMVAAEVPFAALKTNDLEERARIARLPAPNEARRAGRTRFLHPGVPFLRPDWEAIKSAVLTAIVDVKFDEDDLARRLLATGWAVLKEGTGLDTTGHVDRCWGIERATGVGQNRLGRIQMVKRACLAIARRVDLPALSSARTGTPLYAIRVRASDGLARPVSACVSRAPDPDAMLLHLASETIPFTFDDRSSRTNLVIRRSSPTLDIDGFLIPAQELSRLLATA
jgi:predicted NAD-dependent protein-ADP-ribosyltransferase YbiA (DUF1768 family)